MWFLYLLLVYSSLLSFAFYSSKSTWIRLKCTDTLYVSKGCVYLFFMFAFLLFFSTCRYPKEESDTYNYFEYFDSVLNGFHDEDFTFTTEWGYWLLNKIIAALTSNHQIFLLIINVLMLSSIFLFIKRYSVSVWISVLLFILLGFYDGSMNSIRAYMAIAIVLYSYKYMLQRRFLMFLLFVFIASLFHLSMWIFILAYIPFLLDRVNTTWRFFCFYLLAVVSCYFVSNNILTFVFENVPMYASYAEDSTFGIQENVKLAPVLNFLIAFAMIVFCKLVLNAHENNTPINTLLFKLLIWASLFLVLSFKFTQIGRVATYFWLPSIILIPNVINLIDKKRTRFIVTFLFLSVLTLRYVIIAYFRPEWTLVYPYKFFFD